MASALSIGASLFVLYGVVWMLIGALTPALHDTPAGRSTLVFSSSTDTATFGDTPSSILDKDPALAKLRSVLLLILAGFLVVAGAMVVALAYFGVRAGARWALVTLTVVGIVAPSFWFLAARPFLAAGTKIALLDIPPFMWVPTALFVPAALLSWRAI